MIEMVGAFDPAQPRDETGQWSDGASHYEGPGGHFSVREENGQHEVRRHDGDAVTVVDTYWNDGVRAHAHARAVARGVRAAEKGVSRAVVVIEAPVVLWPTLERMAARIEDDDLTGKGRQKDFHVTVRWGLTNDDPAEVREALSSQQQPMVRLGKTSVFAGDDYDVVKISVESDGLRELNKTLGRLPHDMTFDYDPHLTLAYVKPGLGIKYAGMDDLEEKGWTANEAVFSDSEEQRTVLPIGGIVLIGAAAPSHYRLSKFAADHAAELVKAPKKVREAIRNEVRKALRNGEGPDGIADRLFETVDMTPAEIQRIAETEFVIARTGAALEQLDAEGAAAKGWVLGAGEEGCQICQALDGTVVSLDEPFVLDGEEFDGPPAHPNCHCEIEEADAVLVRAAIEFIGAEFDESQHPRDEQGQWTESDVSHDEWRKNADVVAANPEKASVKDLNRASSYLSHKRTALIYYAQKSGSVVNDRLIRSIDSEIEYYDSLVRGKS